MRGEAARLGEALEHQRGVGDGHAGEVLLAAPRSPRRSRGPRRRRRRRRRGERLDRVGGAAERGRAGAHAVGERRPRPRRRPRRARPSRARRRTAGSRPRRPARARTRRPRAASPAITAALSIPTSRPKLRGGASSHERAVARDRLAPAARAPRSSSPSSSARRPSPSARIAASISSTCGPGSISGILPHVSYSVLHIDDAERIRADGFWWRPLRKALGTTAFGINGYTADAGGEVIETHDETSPGAAGHEELYVVVSGAAAFTVDGDEVAAPAGHDAARPARHAARRDRHRARHDRARDRRRARRGRPADGVRVLVRGRAATTARATTRAPIEIASAGPRRLARAPVAALPARLLRGAARRPRGRDRAPADRVRRRTRTRAAGRRATTTSRPCATTRAR